MKYSIFIPVRKGSERVIKKNTRNFAGIEGGLLYLKLSQLKNLPADIEVIISTNDDNCVEIAKKFQNKLKNLKVIDRPEELGKSTTPLHELIRHAGEISSGDSVLWTHVTSPFCELQDYLKAFKIYENRLDANYDSLISGRDYKEFLLDKKSGEIVNNNTTLSWPRTQDLSDWFEINNAIFLTTRENYKNGHRIGSRPILHLQDKIRSLDIDNEEDFRIAEAVYDKFYK